MGDVNAVENDAAVGGRQEFGQQIKKRRLARPMGPNQRMNVTALALKVKLVDGDKPFELLGQTACLENNINWQMVLQKIKVSTTIQEVFFPFFHCLIQKLLDLKNGSNKKLSNSSVRSALCASGYTLA